MARTSLDDIEKQSKRERKAFPTWARLALLGALPLVALTGIAGGVRSQRLVDDNDPVILSLEGPTALRSGLFFETDVAVAADRPIADAVIAVPATLWTGLTINSTVPVASDEEYKGGEYRFHFGSLAAGDRLNFKIDGQVNPSHRGQRQGRIRLLDGDAEIATVPMTLRVFP